MFVSKTVLVTGSSGYIGGQTMLQLRDQGHTVIGLDQRPLPAHLTGVATKFYQLDIGSAAALDLLYQFDFHAIIHCAGTSLVGPSMERPSDYYSNNFEKTKKLCDHILTLPQQPRLIFSSSAATYGNPVICPASEEDPVEPISPYGESKLMVEWMLRAYHRAHGLDYVAFRYFNACGADPQGRHGQESGATHIIARMLEQHRRGETFLINGNDYPTPDGTCIRDYLHVSDIVDAHILALDAKIDAGVYNLGTGQGHSNLEIHHAACRLVAPIAMAFGPARPGDPAMLTASSALFQSTAGWCPKYDLDQIIEHAWQWYGLSSPI